MGGKYLCTQLEKVIPVYNRTDVLGLQIYLRDRFADWANNGSSVEEIWNNLKNIVHESLERFVPHKTLKINSDPEYYNKEIGRASCRERV